jgi:hypothetical protein
MKGFKTPTRPVKTKKGMPTKAPEKSSFKAPDLTDRIPNVRPSTMRNLGPWNGSKG